MGDRPADVTFLGVLWGATGLLNVFRSFVTFSISPLSGFVLLLVGAFGVLEAWGLFSGKKWAWWIQVIAAIGVVIYGLYLAVNTALSHEGAFQMIGVVTSIGYVIIGAVIAWAFNRQNVKEFFGM